MPKKTINDLYKYAKENSLPLLNTDFTSAVDEVNDFWSLYKEDSDQYDRIFARLFKYFIFFDQTGEEEIDDLLEEFNYAVLDFLTLNDKKYSQLYYIYRYENETPFNDINLTEETVEDRDRGYTSGARSDSSSSTSPQYTDVVTNYKMAFDSQAFAPDNKSETQSAQKIFSSSLTKGQQIDSETNDNTITKTTTGSTKSENENIKQFRELWDSYDFYKHIFSDICAELLLVD